MVKIYSLLKYNDAYTALVGGGGRFSGGLVGFTAL